MMPEEARKDYANFKISEEKIKEYQENFHWSLKPIDSELTESDKLMLFFIDSMSKGRWYGEINSF